MAEGLYIDAKQLTKGAKAFDQLIKTLPVQVDDVLNAAAKEVKAQASRNAPHDRGTLGERISANTETPLKKFISVGVPYAAYIEFGTGSYAAAQVSKYPAQYQEFAAQFQGSAGSAIGFKKFVELIAAWILRKGIVAAYSVATQKRIGTGKSKAEGERANQMAYPIARAILVKGVHPHPFLIPALIDHSDDIIKNLTTLLNRLNLNV